MSTCLLMIDLQNDYFPGGIMKLVDIEEAAENARILLTEFRKAQAHVIHIQHIAISPDAFFFLPETDRAKIHDRVTPREAEVVVVKNYPNSFRDTALSEILRNAHIDDLVICGAMIHMCIDATTRAAVGLGFNCTIAEDACATMDLLFNDKIIKASEVHASFMAALSILYAKVLLTRDIVKDMVY